MKGDNMDFYNFLSERLPNESAAGLVYYVSITGALMLICAAMNIIINRVLLKIISKIIRNNKYKWDDVLLETKVFQRIALIVPGVIFYSFAILNPLTRLFCSGTFLLKKRRVPIACYSRISPSIWKVFTLVILTFTISPTKSLLPLK
jgi:hypothetical protein